MGAGNVRIVMLVIACAVLILAGLITGGVGVWLYIQDRSTDTLISSLLIGAMLLFVGVGLLLPA